MLVLHKAYVSPSIQRKENGLDEFYQCNQLLKSSPKIVLHHCPKTNTISVPCKVINLVTNIKIKSDFYHVKIGFADHKLFEF